MRDLARKFEQLKGHFRSGLPFYAWVIFAGVVGLGVGIYLCLSGRSAFGLLNFADKNMLSYISGSADYVSIFCLRLADILLGFVIIVLFSLSQVSSYFGAAFIGFQSALMVLLMGALIKLYGVLGVINSLLFVLPVNLANLFVLSFTLAIGHERAHLMHSYKLRFLESFRETDYFFRLALSFLALFALCLLSCFILPLLVKSFIVVNF